MCKKTLLALLRRYLKWLFTVAFCRGNLRLFVMGIYRSYLPWFLFVKICRGFLPQKIAAAIYRGIFVYKQTFFLWEQTFFSSKLNIFLKKQTFFMCEWAFFLFMRISLLTVFLFVISVVVMCHFKHTNSLNYEVF